ncbi:MAG: two-component regulator propeller domain-containing protein [Eubacteriales bacterium]|nr:two-component regulator propeller domain-containing protein [Eubacteriales bacterium]
MFVIAVICSLIFIPIYGIDIYHIGIEDGLSQISVLSITQDNIGRMWFGTEEGINLYDGSRVQPFQVSQRIKSKKSKENEFLGNYTSHLVMDSRNRLFFSSDKCLVYYDIIEDSFEDLGMYASAIYSSEDTVWFANDQILYYYINDSIQNYFQFKDYTIINSIKGLGSSMLIGTSNGLYQLSSDKKIQTILPNIPVASFIVDSKNNIWVATRNRGIYRISAKDYSIKHWTTNTIESKASKYLQNNDVRCFVEDDYGQIWIGTFKGLSLFDLHIDEFVKCPIDNQHEKLSHQSVYALYKDNQGSIWVGTYYGGVDYFHPHKVIYSYYTASADLFSLSHQQLSFPFVGDMVEDENQNLWICTEGGGLNKLNQKENTFEHFLLSSKWTNDITYHLNLKAIVYDKPSNTLFIGTHTGGLVAYDVKKNHFFYFYDELKEYKHKLGAQVDHLQIYDRTLFIQIKGGIYTYQIDKKDAEFMPLFNNKKYENYWIRTFFIDSQGYIWLAGYDCLSSININNPTDKKVFDPDIYDYGKFSITSFAEDKNGRIYLGTRGSGLYCYETDKNVFLHYSTENNKLLSNYCYDIHFAASGRLFILGNNGVTIFDIDKLHSKLLSFPAKIQFKGFNVGSKIYTNTEGTIFIGSMNGLIFFKEEDLIHQSTKNHLYFSSLNINNHPITPSKNPKILKTTLPFAKTIHLQPNQTNFSIQFASNNYIKSNQCGVYEYKLEGLDKEWLTTSVHTITYNNLNYGKYKLLVREKSNKEGFYKYPQQAELFIHLHAPFYLSSTFKVSLVIFITFLTIIFFRFKSNQMRLANSLQLEREKQIKIKEWDEAKTNFFTMISHELKTPLTLIITHIDLLLNNKSLPSSIKPEMKRIRFDADSLKDLSSELILFEKFQQNALRLSVSRVDIFPIMNSIYKSFQSLAESRQINFNFKYPDNPLFLWIDVSAFKKIIINLVSNALKYTPKEGNIDIIVYNDKNEVKIQVIDTGSGISVEEQEKIFKRYYQSTHDGRTSFSQSGSGIGLTLVKHLVEMHKGTISVNSAKDYGTIFTINLKKGYAHFDKNDQTIYRDHVGVNAERECDVSLTLESSELNMVGKSNKKEQPNYTILIVDDNSELLSLLKEVFGPLYKVVTAKNGKQAWDIIKINKPDIIVCDIVMPIMNGYEFCRKVKNSRYCDIPILLLSALTTEESQNKAFASKADAFMAKPFIIRQLVVRCNSLLNNSLQVRKKYINDSGKSDNSGPLPSILAQSRDDLKFMKQVDNLIDTNYEKEDFDIDELIKRMYISRSLFYDKFKELKAVSPSEYLRIFRMKKAADFLVKNPELSISEIAYKVGYSSPKYFSKSFKKHFNYTPSDYRYNSKNME